MSDRKNIKVPAETYEKLKDEKGQYETWPVFFDRVLEGDYPDPRGE
jgi:hypothetical protein